MFFYTFIPTLAAMSAVSFGPATPRTAVSVPGWPESPLYSHAIISNGNVYEINKVLATYIHFIVVLGENPNYAATLATEGCLLALRAALSAQIPPHCTV